MIRVLRTKRLIVSYANLHKDIKPESRIVCVASMQFGVAHDVSEGCMLLQESSDWKDVMI